jgi:endoglucanase
MIVYDYIVDDDGEQIQGDFPADSPTVTMWLQGIGSQLTLQDSTPFLIQGVNWAGFESRMFPGLLSVRAYKTVAVNGLPQQGIIDQIASLGFNAIRMPVCIDMTWSNAVCQPFDGICTALNPDLLSSSYVGPIDLNTNVNGANLIAPMQILDKIVAYAKSLGLRIILDMHCSAPNVNEQIGFNGRWYTSDGPNGAGGTTMGLPNDPRNEAQLTAAWVTLAQRYANEPAMCGFDLVNEPWATTWDSDPVTGIAAAYERIGAAIQAVNPNVMIICEGNQITPANPPNYPSKYDSWPVYGQNLYGVHTRRISLPIQNKLAYAPHEYYGPGYQWTQSYSFPSTMSEVWTTLWGFIVQRGYAPVIITEWGGNFSGNIPANCKWAYAFMEYLYTELGGTVSWCHWAMVPGSYSTGADQSVVGLIEQVDTVGGSNNLWPQQQAMAQLFIAGSQIPNIPQ